MSPALNAALRTGLVDAARLRLLLPDADPDEIRPFYGDKLEGFWAVPLLADGRGRVVVMQTDGDVVLPHAGLARAAERLRSLTILGADEMVLRRLRAVLDAVGGLTPGAYRYPREQVEFRETGTRLTFSEPESWVRFAAGGGIGPPPVGRSYEPRGVTPPEPEGEVVCDLSAGYELRWSYTVAGVELGTYTGHPDDDVADELDHNDAERAVAAARRSIASPLAMPSAPVSLTDDRRWRVDFYGHDAVIVDPAEDGG